MFLTNLSSSQARSTEHCPSSHGAKPMTSDRIFVEKHVSMLAGAWAHPKAGAQRTLATMFLSEILCVLGRFVLTEVRLPDYIDHDIGEVGAKCIPDGSLRAHPRPGDVYLEIWSVAAPLE